MVNAQQNVTTHPN